MVCCCMLGPATLLLVATTSQLSGALRIIDKMPAAGYAGAAVGGKPEGSNEFLSEDAAKRMHRRRRGVLYRRFNKRDQDYQDLGPLRTQHRRRGRVRPFPLIGVDSIGSAFTSSSESVAESSSNSAHNSSSDSEAEDDIVIILENHTDSIPSHLPALQSRPVNRQPLRVVKPLLVPGRNRHNLQETGTTPTKLESLDGSENPDRRSGCLQRTDRLEDQAVQKKMVISRLCTHKHLERSIDSRGSSKTFTKGVVRAVERIISKRLIFRPRRDGSRIREVDPNLESLRDILHDWKKEDQGHIAAKALLNASNAMFREEKTMSPLSLQRTIRLYDDIIAILMENVGADSPSTFQHGR